MTSRAERAAAAREALPPNNILIPQEHLVPGRLELTAKFSELPQPLVVQGGLKIGIQTGEGLVTAILPPKVWRTLEQVAKDYRHWVAALSGSLERFADGEIALQHPAVQVFEKKAKPEAALAAAVEVALPPAPAPKAPEVNVPEAKARTASASPAPSAGAAYPKLRLKGRGTPSDAA